MPPKPASQRPDSSIPKADRKALACSDRIFQGAQSILESGFPISESKALLLVWEGALQGALLSGAPEASVRSQALKRLSKGVSAAMGERPESHPQKGSWVSFFLEAAALSSRGFPSSASLLLCCDAPLPAFAALAERAPCEPSETRRVAKALLSSGRFSRGAFLIGAGERPEALLEAPEGDVPHIGYAWRSGAPWRKAQAAFDRSILLSFEAIDSFAGGPEPHEFWRFELRSVSPAIGQAAAAFPKKLDSAPPGVSLGEIAAAAFVLRDLKAAKALLEPLRARALQEGRPASIPEDFSLAAAFGAPISSLAALAPWMPRDGDPALSETLCKIMLGRAAGSSSVPASIFSSALALASESISEAFSPEGPAESAASLAASDPRFSRFAPLLAHSLPYLALRCGALGKIDPFSEKGAILQDMIRLGFRRRAQDGSLPEPTTQEARLLSGKSALRMAWRSAVEALRLEVASSPAPAASARRRGAL